MRADPTIQRRWGDHANRLVSVVALALARALPSPRAGKLTPEQYRQMLDDMRTGTRSDERYEQC